MKGVTDRQFWQIAMLPQESEDGEVRTRLDEE
jgi:hypothetical protein